MNCIRFVIVLDSCCISIGLVLIKDRPVSSFWVLRFRVLGASFSIFRGLRFRVLGASFSKLPFKFPQINSLYYGSREGTIQKYFANPKKYFKSQYFSQITVEKFDKPKKLLQILRKFVDPQITFSIIRKYFANP